LLLLLAAQPTPSSASNTWSDTDPVATITTPGGHTVPVYVQVGAQAPGTLADAQAARILWTVKSVQAGAATQIELSTVVPCDPLIGCQFNTRCIPSSGPWGTGTVYGSASSTAGNVMTVKFTVNVP
jgi:hypothetical protein